MLEILKYKEDKVSSSSWKISYFMALLNVSSMRASQFNLCSDFPKGGLWQTGCTQSAFNFSAFPDTFLFLPHSLSISRSLPLCLLCLGKQQQFGQLAMQSKANKAESRTTITLTGTQPHQSRIAELSNSVCTVSRERETEERAGRESQNSSWVRQWTQWGVLVSS